MPLASLPLIGFAIGAMMTLAATRGGRERGADMDAPFRLVLLLSLLVHTPAATCLLVYHTDWCLSFAFPSDDLPRLAIPLAMFANLISLPLGFLAAERSARSGGTQGVLVRAGIALGAVTLLSALFWTELGTDASYTQFHNGFGTQNLSGSVLGYTLIWMVVMLLAGTLYTHHSIRACTLPPYNRASPPNVTP